MSCERKKLARLERKMDRRSSLYKVAGANASFDLGLCCSRAPDVGSAERLMLGCDPLALRGT